MRLPFDKNGRTARAVLLCLLAASCTAPPSRGGGGIVSTNPCADAMLIELVPASRIAAISQYSHDATAGSIPMDVARRFRTTTGTAEEVIALNPDLVVASSFTASSTREAYARAGLKTLYLDSPVTIEASKTQVTELARAIGAEGAGAAMNARIDAGVAAATQSGEAVPALVWISGNLVSGGGNLLDELLGVAGFSNQAAHYGLQFTGTLPIERVVIDPPSAMLVPDAPGRMASSRAAEMRTRALAHLGRRVTEVPFDRQLVNCGGPVIPRALARLAEVRRGLQ